MSASATISKYKLTSNQVVALENGKTFSSICTIPNLTPNSTIIREQSLNETSIITS